MDRFRFLYFFPYALSALLAAIGLPLALNLIEPNRTYGIRIQKTLESVEAWYAINSVGGLLMVMFSILSMIIVFLLHKYWGTESELKLAVPIFVPIALTLYSILIAIRGT